MKKLSFIGIGGAVNTELGGNCSYYKDKNKLLVIDMCECATEKLKKLNVFENVENIYIAITHTHFDHIAGLGVFIWYCNFYLTIKPQIIYSNRKYLSHIKKLLKLTGVDIKYVEFLKDTNFKIDNLKMKLYPTIHSPDLQCFGIMFTDALGQYYYTGDTSDINYIKKLNDISSVKKIYTEVATETYDVHIKYEDILNFNKEKLVLMHFDTTKLLNRAVKDGFEVARIE